KANPARQPHGLRVRGGRRRVRHCVLPRPGGPVCTHRAARPDACLPDRGRVHAVCGRRPRHAVRHAGGDQHDGEPAPASGQGHDATLHLLWRLLAHLARLRHGHAACADARPPALAKTAAVLAIGVVKAWRLLGRLDPVVVVGFGGYPTVPPVLAATFRRVPTVVHDANAVIGRANRLLAPRVTAIATTFAGVLDGEPSLAAKATHTGNPVRPMVIAAAATPYAAPAPDGPLRL